MIFKAKGLLMKLQGPTQMETESSIQITSPSSSRPIHLYTIGFTKKSAEAFFTKLREAGVRRVIDVRLNNVSQLAGFSKKEDLAYFLRTICGIEYFHKLELAPTQELLDTYKKQKGTWADYELQFIELMTARQIEHCVSMELMDGACLLCSEDKPERCHRRLVAEYLQEKWHDVEITHIT